MPGESGGDPTFDDGVIIVLSKANVPRRTPSAGSVSHPLSGVTLSSIYVSQGERTFYNDVVQNVELSTIAV